MGAVAPPKQARTRQQHLQVLLGTRGYAVCRRCLRAVESPPVLCRWMVFAVRTSVSRHWWWSSTDPAPSTYLPGSMTPVSPGVTKPYGGGSEAGGMGWPRHLGLFSRLSKGRVTEVLCFSTPPHQRWHRGDTCCCKTSRAGRATQRAGYWDCDTSVSLRCCGRLDPAFLHVRHCRWHSASRRRAQLVSGRPRARGPLDVQHQLLCRRRRASMATASLPRSCRRPKQCTPAARALWCPGKRAV